MSTFQNIPLSQIQASPTNPRKRFKDEDLNELASSIRQHGVMQPILVRPIPQTDNFEIVAGERRWRASTIAQAETIPAIVRELDDDTAMELQILENLQRSDLHPLEEAAGFEALLHKHTGQWNADMLAEKTGKSRTYIYNSLKLLSLGTYVQDKCYDDSIKRETALLIARIPSHTIQEQAAKRIISQEMSYRTALQYLKQEFTLDLTLAKWDKLSTKLTGTETECVSCLSCPKRTGNYPELYPDIESADVCTDIDCYNTKKKAFAQHLIATTPGVIHGEEAKQIAPHGVNSYVTNGYSSDLKHIWIRHDDELLEYYEIFEQDEPPPSVTIIDENGNSKQIYKTEEVQTLMRERLQAKIDSGELIAAPKEPDEYDKKADLREEEKQRRLHMFNRVMPKVSTEHLPAVLAHAIRCIATESGSEISAKSLNYSGSNQEFAMNYTDAEMETAYRTKNTDTLVKVLAMITFERAMLIGWQWSNPAHNETDSEYQDFLRFITNIGLDLAEITTAELPFTPNPAAQAQELTPEEQAQTPEPSAPAPLDAEKTAEADRFAEIREKEQARRARKAQRQTQKESADADV